VEGPTKAWRVIAVLLGGVLVDAPLTSGRGSEQITSNQTY